MSQNFTVTPEEIESVKAGLAAAEAERNKGLEAADNIKGDHGPGPGPGPGKPKHGGSQIALGPTFKRLLAYAKPVVPMMVFAMIFAVLGVIMTVISPDYLAKITDEIQAGFTGEINMGKVSDLARISVVLLLISLLASLLEGILMARATVWISRTMRTDLDRKIDHLPLSYFDKTTTGDNLSRVTNDVDTLQQTLSNSVATMITGIITLVGAAWMMFVTSWQLALAAILASLLGIAGSGLIMGKSQKFFFAQQQQLGALNGHIEESFSGHTVIRAYNAEQASLAEFERRNHALFASAWKAQFLSGLMMPLMTFIGNLGYVVVCVVGAILALKGTITVGVIVAFIVYIRIFTNPLGQIAQSATSFQSAAAAGTRVFDFLDAQEMPAEASSTKLSKEVAGRVDFSQVKFGYVPEQEIIHDFTATVQAGQKVAIVGPTGAGKTTLVNLLMRFYDLWDGSISIDGQDIAQLPREEVDDLFAMVLQDTWLFEGSLRENLIYRAEGVSEERLRQVVEQVGLDELVAQLPSGLDSVLSDSTALSAGQKQLVTIARAMLADKPLLILDEATSSVDTRTELLIQRALDSLAQGRTSFVIAHRLSTIRNADLIFVMKDGDVIETGNHEQLLAAGGFYAELYNSQFDN